MPFIRGRYHINPIMGEALEAAREAEAALLALEQEAQQNRQGESGDSERSRAGTEGRIRRIEIDAAEMVPPQSGLAVRGYVARVHREPAAGAAAAGEDSDWRDAGGGTFASHDSGNSGPETRAFSDHRDLIDFLHNELANNEQ